MDQEKVTKPASRTAALPKISEWPGAFGIYKYSKQAIMLNLNTYVVLLVIAAVINGLTNLVAGSKPSAMFVIASLLGAAISTILSIAVVIVQLSGVNNKKVSFSEALNGISKYIVNYIIAAIVIGVAAFVSFLLFVIPAFFVIPRLVFTYFLIVDKNMDGIDAVQTSWNMTKGHLGKIYGIIGATIAMALLAITIIGIPFAIYFVIMYGAAMAVLYSHIVNKK